jgi:hypothetical protein
VPKPFCALVLTERFAADPTKTHEPAALDRCVPASMIVVVSVVPLVEFSASQKTSAAGTAVKSASRS